MDAETAISLFSEANHTNYYVISRAGFLLYDMIICFDNELKFFWSKPKKKISWLFYSIRAFAIIELLPWIIQNSKSGFGSSLCLGLGIFNEVSNCLFLLAIDYAILLRVLALYADEPKMKKFFAVFFIICAVTSIPLGIRATNLSKFSAISFTPRQTYCFSLTPVNVVEFCISWGIVMFYGLVLMAFALRKAAILWKEAEGLSGVRLVTVLIRDQALYFLASVIVGVLVVIEFTVPLSDTMGDIVLFIANPSILSPIGCRLLTNMKEAGEHGINAGTSCGLPTLTQINFASTMIPLEERSQFWDA